MINGNRHVLVHIVRNCDNGLELINLVGEDFAAPTLLRDLQLSDFKDGEELILIRKRDLDRIWDYRADNDTPNHSSLR